MRAVLLLITTVLGVAEAQAPKSGEDVIRLMYNRYAGKWYQTLTFVQKTSLVDAGGNPTGVETWYEAMHLPGYLRIDIAPLDSGKAIIFRSDSVYQLHGGRIESARPYVHPLLVLGFDVYADAPDVTIDKLRRLNFDLSRLGSGVWQGKKVWIVGAADTNDTRPPQFWIQQDNLLFVRMLRPSPQGGVQETQFNRYVRLGGGWVSPEVQFYVNGQKGTTEEYSDLKTGVTFAPDLFNPSKFGPPGWVK